jgi:hypothetical protein
LDLEIQLLEQGSHPAYDSKLEEFQMTKETRLKRAQERFEATQRNIKGAYAAALQLAHDTMNVRLYM